MRPGFASSPDSCKTRLQGGCIVLTVPMAKQRSMSWSRYAWCVLLAKSNDLLKAASLNRKPSNFHDICVEYLHGLAACKADVAIGGRNSWVSWLMHTAGGRGMGLLTARPAIWDVGGHAGSAFPLLVGCPGRDVSILAGWS